MLDSPVNRHPNPQNPQNPKTQKRICDFCCESPALLYCRADSAKLCLSCDREVHSTNQLFSKHTRFQLCDACDSSPASILCFTEHSVLCQNCDFELHSYPGSCNSHDRRPLEGFCGCPSAPELSAIVGFQGFDSKCLDVDEEKKGFDGSFLSGLEENDDGFSDLFVWDNPGVVSIDELIGSTDKDHNFQATVVPPLPKDWNSSCGQHKQEILHQLRKLAKSEPIKEQDSVALVNKHHTKADETEKDFRVPQVVRAFQHDEKPSTLRGHEARSYTWGNDAGETINDIFVSPALSGSHIEESALNSDINSSISSTVNHATDGSNSQNPVATEPSAFLPKVATVEFNTAERDSALSRYKEKRRTRRYDKHIRYESRKVQAEHRTRIKGRFAKVDHCMNQAHDKHKG